MPDEPEVNEPEGDDVEAEAPALGELDVLDNQIDPGDVLGGQGGGPVDVNGDGKPERGNPGDVRVKVPGGLVPPVRPGVPGQNR